MLHELKLNQKYCDSVYWGVKPFEIRFNDREFNVGDFVRFIAVNDDGFLVGHEINSCYYQITYVLSDFCGLAENYVALGIESFKCFHDCCAEFGEHGIEACFDCTGSKIESQQGN